MLTQSLSLTQDIEIPNEIYNLISFLNLMAECLNGRNEASETKCDHAVMNIKATTQMFQIADVIWPLKTAIIKYARNCFLETAKDTVLENHQ